MAAYSMSGAVPGAWPSPWPSAEQADGLRASTLLLPIAFAQSRPAAAAIDFAVGDASGLPYSDRRFTAALAQLSREMRRVVRPGGVVAAAVWDYRGGLVFQRLFWDTAAELDAAAGAARDKLFSSPLALPEGLPLLWRETGLTAVEYGSITIRMDFADFADYWEPAARRSGSGRELRRRPVT
jgi:SAM-dependent methyltransferase